MKKHALRMICAVFAAVMLFGAVFSTPCSAYVKNGPVIDVAVIPTQDENFIRVDISFPENPGIGAMTFTLLYDHTTFAAAPYDKRYFYYVPDTNIKKYLIVDHPSDGYVSIVWSPEGSADLYTGTGVAFSLHFRIDHQISGKHPFEIGNIQPITKGKDLSGCFSDFEHNTFTPKANNDAYVIGGDNNIPDSYPWKDKNTEQTDPQGHIGEHTHNYVLHKKVAPSCTSEGYSIYECSVCGEKQTKDKASALGHSFNGYWTVDRAATGSVAMKLSRHCSRCNSSTDVYYYTLESVNKLGIKNEVGAKVEGNAAEGLVKDNGTVPNAENDTGTDIDPEKIKNAEDIIEAAKKKAESETPTGKVKKAYNFFEMLYMYLFGTAEKPGIFRIIFMAVMKLFGL